MVRNYLFWSSVIFKQQSLHIGDHSISPSRQIIALMTKENSRHLKIKENEKRLYKTKPVQKRDTKDKIIKDKTRKEKTIQR